METHRNWFLHPNFRLFRRISGLNGLAGARARVLDVGCGRGDLLFFLEKQNPSWDLTGIDLARLPSHPSIRFISEDLFVWNPCKKYSVVISLAVIEHVENIRRFLEKIREVTDQGGQIVLMTLNEDSLVYLMARALHRMGLSGPFHRLYSRHHRHHFTPRSLRRLVEESGLKITSHITHNFPLAAVDFPSQGFLLDALQKIGVGTLFGAGSLVGKGFLQTLVCRP